MSSAETMRAYVRERFPLRRFVPLALVLAAPGMLAGTSLASGIQIFAVPLAVLLAVLAFRIVDDLADRTHDAAAVPGRITVRTPSSWGFTALSAVAGAVAVMLFAAAGDGSARLRPAMTATVLLAAWYPLRQRLGSTRLLNAHVVLLKYPLLVLAAAGSSGARPVVLSAAGLLYVAMLIHEQLDDRELRRRPRTLLLAHGLALLILGALLLRAATLAPVST